VNLPNQNSTDIFEPLKAYTAYFYLVLILFIILIAYWVYQDSKKRGFGQYFWSILVIFGGIVFPFIYNAIGNPTWIFHILSFPIGGIIPLLIYLIVRPLWTKDDLELDKLEKETLQLEREYWAFLLSKEKMKCPNCGAPIKENWLICPYCKTVLKKECSFCGKPIDLDWDMCPYCGHKQKEEEKK